MLKVFYCCYSTGDDVSGAEARTIDRESALGIAQSMLQEPRDYVGFVDASDTTLQFMVEDSGLIWMEVPVPEEGGSYGKTVSLNEAESVIASLPAAFNKNCVAGLKFQRW